MREEQRRVDPLLGGRTVTFAEMCTGHDQLHFAEIRPDQDLLTQIQSDHDQTDEVDLKTKAMWPDGASKTEAQLKAYWKKLKHAPSLDESGVHEMDLDKMLGKTSTPFMARSCHIIQPQEFHEKDREGCDKPVRVRSSTLPTDQSFYEKQLSGLSHWQKIQWWSGLAAQVASLSQSQTIFDDKIKKMEGALKSQLDELKTQLDVPNNQIRETLKDAVDKCLKNKLPGFYEQHAKFDRMTKVLQHFSDSLQC